MKTIESKVEALQQHITNNSLDVPFSAAQLTELLLIADNDFYIARDMVDSIHYDKAKGRVTPDLITLAEECIQNSKEGALSDQGYMEESRSIYGDERDNGYDYG
jgi:hypothetical protein